jgi:hypothetical protein
LRDQGAHHRVPGAGRVDRLDARCPYLHKLFFVADERTGRAEGDHDGGRAGQARGNRGGVGAPQHVGVGGAELDQVGRCRELLDHRPVRGDIVEQERAGIGVEHLARPRNGPGGAGGGERRLAEHRDGAGVDDACAA